MFSSSQIPELAHTNKCWASTTSGRTASATWQLPTPLSGRKVMGCGGNQGGGILGGGEGGEDI